MEWMNASLSDGTETWLPDIAKMVRNRLSNTSRLKSKQHSATAIGESILRQLSEQRAATGSLRLSSSGGCERALAYTYHHTVENGHPIDATSKLAFTIGDVTEAFLVATILEAFEDVSRNEQPQLMCVGENQETVLLSFEIGPNRVVRISGHPDGSMLVPTGDVRGSAGTWSQAILEVKSMSDYAFKKFRKGGLDPSDSYYHQVQAYMAAKGYPLAYVIAYGKATTAKEAAVDDDGQWWPAFPIVGQWIARDQNVVDSIIAKFTRVIQSSSPEDIQRPYGPDKKGRLSFPCDYCRYWKTCFPDGEEFAQESRWLQKTNKIKIGIKGDING